MYWEKVEGWFTYIEFYDKILSKYDNATIVEIGVWKGKSILYLAEHIKNNNKNIKLYAIDTFEGSEEHSLDPDIINHTLYESYLKNIYPLKDFIITIKGSSHDVYTQFDDESIDLLFIDGDHSYEGVKKDISLWYPKIKSGRIMAGHDYSWIDKRVGRAVDEYFNFTPIHSADGDSWFIIK